MGTGPKCVNSEEAIADDVCERLKLANAEVIVYSGRQVVPRTVSASGRVGQVLKGDTAGNDFGIRANDLHLRFLAIV